MDAVGRWQAIGALGLTGLVGVVVVAVINAVLGLGEPWGYVIFVSCVLLLYGGFLAVVERLRRMRWPQIVAHDPGSPLIRHVGSHRDEYGQEKAVAYLFLAIPFSNEAEPRTESAAIAADVIATIEAFDSDGTLIDRSHGSWRELEARVTPDAPPSPGVERAKPLTLAPDGRHHLLEVIAQDRTHLPRLRPSAGCMLVRSPPEYTFFAALGHEMKPGGRYRIEVVLRAASLDGGRVAFSYDLLVPDDPDSPVEPEQSAQLVRRPRRGQR
jgi:hypothetical protein